MVQPGSEDPPDPRESCLAVLDTGNGGQEVHSRAFRLRPEGRLRNLGLRPTWRPVDLRFQGIGGKEQTASREYTFPLGIKGLNL